MAMFTEMKPEPLPSSSVSEDLLVELNIPSEIELVQMVSELGVALMELRGFEEHDIHAVKLAIHETLINAIKYGSIENPAARVRIKFYLKNQATR